MTPQLDPAQVGQKFARLELMRGQGYPVPDFFCLVAAEFDQALKSVSLGPFQAYEAGQDANGSDSLDVEAWCSAAASALAKAVPTGELADRVLKAFDDQIGATELAAVRACVVTTADGTGEDSAADPFAGMSESYLYVPREGLLEAVAKCWASAFTPHAVRYRIHKGIDPTTARVAVGIQRMVLGTQSFVAFTKDPRDVSAGRLVIAAAHGIGEGVVQEKSDVDHFFIDSSTHEVQAEIVSKQWMVTGPKQRGGTPSLERVPAELAEPPVLTDEQARQIAVLATSVEEFFGCPQDIEGTITLDGEIHLVQARPMVINSSGSQVHWGNHNITESFPGISSALTYSQARLFYESIFTDLYRRMGVSNASLSANAPLLGRMIGFLNGRIYYRLDDWQELHSQMPVFEFIRAGWEQQMGITGEVRADRRWSSARAAASLPGIAWRAAGHRRVTRKFLAWWDSLMEEVYESDERSPQELIVLYRRVWDEASRQWGVTLANGLYGLILMRVGTVLLRRWTGSGPELLIGLLAGGAENRTLASTRALIGVAEKAAAVPELRTALLAENASGEQLRNIWDELAAGVYGGEVADAARVYVRQYGDRALHDLKLDEPTPRQRPWMLVSTLQAMVRQGLTVEASRADEARMASQAQARLKESCRNPLRRAVLHGLVAMTRWCAKAREDTRFSRTQLFGITREVMWQLGAELARAGLLDDGQDVVDLTVEEVLGAFDGTLPGSDLRGLAELRRVERLRNIELPALPVLMSVPGDRPLSAALPLAAPAGDVDEHTAGDPSALRGLGSSGGIVRGRAKVVLDPRVQPDDCQGRILIARETDPGWLMLMIAASGIVVERGTLLSHTAITGRLLGIPTVVAVRGATTSIPDGALIELDGTAGTVTILNEMLDDHALTMTASG